MSILIDPDPIVPAPKSSPIDSLENLNPMQRYLVHEFVEDYQDGLMSRRDLLSRVVHIAGGAAAGWRSWQPSASPPRRSTPRSRTYAPSSSPRNRRARYQSRRMIPGLSERTSPSRAAMRRSWPTKLARPMGWRQPRSRAGRRPRSETAAPRSSSSVTRIADLTQHIRDVTRRLAVAGYTACALDLVSRDGGTASIEDPSSIPDLLTAGDPNRHVMDFQAAIAFYGDDSDVDAARVGMIGFCLGGGITWRTATQTPELLAAIPYYGPPPPLEDVPNITAAVLGVYSDDPGDFANEGRDELATALIDAGIAADIRVYPGTQHAFHNDTGQRYNEEQAIAAWEDSLAWFAEHLGA